MCDATPLLPAQVDAIKLCTPNNTCIQAGSWNTGSSNDRLVPGTDYVLSGGQHAGGAGAVCQYYIYNTVSQRMMAVAVVCASCPC